MAKIVITEVDKSQSLAGTGDIKTGAVFYARRGRVDEGVPVNSVEDLIAKYGIMDFRKSVSMYSPYMFLQAATGLIAARTIHTAVEGSVETDSNRTARYSAALLKAVVTPLSDKVEDADYSPEKVLTPLTHGDGFGFTQAQVDAYDFPVYPRTREYKKLRNAVQVPLQSKNMLVLNILEDLDVGSKLSFGETVDDNSVVYTVEEVKQVIEKVQKIVLDKPVEVKAFTPLRRVIITKEAIADGFVKTADNVNATEIEVSDAANLDVLESGSTISFGDETDTYVVQTVDKTAGAKKLVLRTGLKKDLPQNTAIHNHKRTYMVYDKNPQVSRDFSGSDEIFIDNADFIGDGDIITFQDKGVTNAETEFLVESKGLYNEEQKQVILDKPFTSTKDTIIQLMVKSEFESRDVLLIYADNQGVWGNELTVEVVPSVDYPDDARILKVYEKGVLQEQFEVTFDDFVDGLGKQLYVEDRINGNSNLIRVKHNKDCVDAEGKALLPLLNNYSVWRELAEDIFGDYEIPVTTTETLNYGDTDVRINSFEGIENGDRIKFADFPEEYKVTGKSSQKISDTVTEYHITIDRPLEVDEVAKGAKVIKFVEQKFKVAKKIENAYTNNTVGDVVVIGDLAGVLLDAGTNKFIGGHDGSVPDAGDFMQTAEKVFGSRDGITVNQLLSGGVFSPAYQQKLVTIAQRREDCFVWVSNDPSYMDNTNPVAYSQKFRSDLNINSSYASLQADWVQIYDEYNKKFIYVSSDGIAAALQSLASQGGVWGQVTAGWARGVLYMVQRLGYTWSEIEREDLLAYQINPVKKHRSMGLSIWGNKTLQGTRSYLQMRNVRFILIQMNIMLRDYLESIHWEFNDPSTREMVVATIQDSFYNKFLDVVNQIKVFDTTTAVDEDEGNMKIFVGVTPRGVSENIYVTLGVYSNSRGITVSGE